MDKEIVDLMNKEMDSLVDDYAKRRIDDLEAKLAEGEYKVQTLLKSEDVLAVTDIAKMSVDNFNLRKENNDLKQQLAEKEKFLEQIMSGEYIPANIAEKSLKLSNQTAIAELEKVKKLLKHKGMILKVKPPIDLPAVQGNEYLHEFMIPEWDFERIFDQQIKSLKGDDV